MLGFDATRYNELPRVPRSRRPRRRPSMVSSPGDGRETLPTVTVTTTTNATTPAEDAQRLAWVVDHVAKYPAIPLEHKRAIQSFARGRLSSLVKSANETTTTSASESEVNDRVLKAPELSLSLAELEEKTQDFSDLTPVVALECAEILGSMVDADDGVVEGRLVQELVESLSLEWCFGQFREASKKFEGPQKRWKLMENFWLRWKTLKERKPFNEPRSLSVVAREAVDLVEIAESTGKLPDDWPNRVKSPESILNKLAKFVRATSNALGPSFISTLDEDISTGAYKVMLNKGRIIGVIEPPAVDDDAPQKTSAAPKRVKITTERKLTATTVTWDSQGNDTPERIVKDVNRPDPLDNLPWEKERKVFSPEERKKKCKWTKAEEDALERGVEQFGAGQWANILRANADAFNPKRTAVDLKDKWRSLSRKFPPK